MISEKVNFTWFALVIIMFWSGWFSLAFLSNASDLFYALGLIQQPFTFHSGNFDLIKQTIAIYHWPTFIALVIFICDVIIQGLIAVLFIRAAYSMLCGRLHQSTLYWPLLLNIALWAAFMVVEEFFIAYQMEAVHLRLLVLAIMSLFIVRFALIDFNLERV